MIARESWTKDLKCPICGREGVARLSHAEDLSDSYDTVTVIDECPTGFQARLDEDDSNIVRFYCAADETSADQG